MNILFFNDLGGLFHFFAFRLIFFARLLGKSSEVERNPKMNILFFDDLGGPFSFFCILADVFCSDHSADGLVVFWQSSGGLLVVFWCSSTGLLVVFCLSSGSLLPVFCWSSGSLLTVFWWCSGSLLVDHQKMNFLFFDDLGGLFHFFAFWSIFFAQISRPIIRS